MYGINNLPKKQFRANVAGSWFLLAGCIMWSRTLAGTFAEIRHCLKKVAIDKHEAPGTSRCKSNNYTEI